MIPGMLAARHALGGANPKLLEAARNRWSNWLRLQRGDDGPAMEPRLFVAASLTCADDIFLHVGLMQLLGLPGVRCTVMLSLPTPLSARLLQAKARREGWHMLVHILAEEQLSAAVKRLSPQTPLIAFPVPNILSDDAAAQIAALFNSATDPRNPDAMMLKDGFFGRAGAYVDWASSRKSLTTRSIVNSLRAIISQDPAIVGPELPDSTMAPAEADTLSATATVYQRLGRIAFPMVERDDEIVVTSLNNEPSEVLGRRVVSLAEPDQALRFRMPASLLTTYPQTLRVDLQGADGTRCASQVAFHVPPPRLKPWMLSAFLNKGGGGNPVIRAFAHGVGCRIAYAEDEPEILQDIPVVWGVLRDSDRIVAQAKAQGLYFFYIDHAYFNRGHGKAYRIARNQYEAGAIRDCPDDRSSELELEIAPWRKGGREIIVCPPTEYFMTAHGCPDWLATTLATLGQVTDRPIVVRQKPQPGEEAVPLSKALETAHALVTHSSNVAIEAACMGTPVFVAPASAAAPIGCLDLNSIEQPVYPDRRAWLAHLAYNQFSFDEIRDGRAWRMLLELEERDFV